MDKDKEAWPGELMTPAEVRGVVDREAACGTLILGMLCGVRVLSEVC